MCFVRIARQTYLRLTLQSAELKIDTTPVEGFNNEWVDEVLDLKKHGLKSFTNVRWLRRSGKRLGRVNEKSTYSKRRICNGILNKKADKRISFICFFIFSDR